MQPNISFEFFPPRTEHGVSSLIDTAKELAELKPEFYSVTFGAGGSVQEKTSETVFTLKQETALSVAPHISCVNSTKENIAGLLRLYIERDIKHLVVLRGDHPSGSVGGIGKFRHANELVDFIRHETGDHFYIHVAAFPEFHPDSKNATDDFKHFKNKVAKGVNAAITQYFFNIDAYCFFRDWCVKEGIHIPIIPGIMPITNFSGIKRFSAICGAEIPRWMAERFNAYGDDLQAIQQLGFDIVLKLCQRLITEGAPGLHFYTLNKSQPTIDICQKLAIV